jgi:OOP family OmpA-OmpF porin
VTAGAGWRNADNPINPRPNRFDSSDIVTNVGGGLKYFVTDNLALRVDARYYMDMEDDNGYNGNDLPVLAGLHITFGAPQPEPAPMKKEEPKPAPMAPADSDGDGVTDDRDKCPNTPKGTKVDADGCPVVSAEVRPQYKAALGDVAAFMGKHSSAVATIEGHTDSTGPESYNQGLSERRANSIATYLTDNKGVSANRLKTVGYGESRPVADNATREGRQRNRRVIAVIIESK